MALKAVGSTPIAHPRKKDDLRKKIVFFCSFHFSLFVLLSSLKKSFSGSKEILRIGELASKAPSDGRRRSKGSVKGPPTKEGGGERGTGV